MDGFLTEIGKKLAERWLGLLVLPGLLFAGAAWCAWALGHGHALDLPLLIAQTRRSVASARADGPTVVILVSLVLLVAAAAGLAAQAAARLVEYGWLRERKGAPATRIGRRLRLAAGRVEAEYHGLQVSPLWPRLWLVLPDGQRQTLGEARGAVDAAARTGGWGLLYLGLGALWWPGLLAGAVLLAVSWRDARARVDAYATLVEAAVDVNQTLIAEALGVTLAHGVITADEASQINVRLAKRAVRPPDEQAQPSEQEKPPEQGEPDGQEKPSEHRRPDMEEEPSGQRRPDVEGEPSEQGEQDGQAETAVR